MPDKDDRDISGESKTSQQTAVSEQAYTAEENSSEINRQGAGSEDTKVENSENEISTDEDMAESMLNTEVFQAAASADCVIQDNAADTEEMDEDKSVLTQPTVGSSGGSSGSAENGEDISYSESGSYPAGNESSDDSIGSDSAPMASGGGGLQQSASPAAEMEAKSFNITEISKDKAKEQLEGGKYVTVNGIQASIYTVSDEFIRVYYIMDGKGYIIEFEGYTLDEVTNELEDIV